MNAQPAGLLVPIACCLLSAALANAAEDSGKPAKKAVRHSVSDHF